jgi:FkbM family methyltransferase
LAEHPLARSLAPGRRRPLRGTFNFFKVVFYLVACARRPAVYLWWKSAGFRIAGAFGLYEAAHFRFLSSVLPRGGRFVDVGAHYGVYTRFLLGRAGSDGAVFAFEPHPEVFAALQRQFAGRRNCRLFRLALSSRRREGLYLCVPKLYGIVPEPALSHLSTTLEVGAIPVEVRRLDDFAAELARIDFIKADIEGGELEFLEGSSEIIATHRPLILFECMDMDRQYDVLRGFAEPRGYRLCALDAEGRPQSVKPGDSGRRDVNFYLMPSESTAPSPRANTR